MTSKVILVLALIAGLGSGVAGEVNDDLWTISPYAFCADDGNPALRAPLAPGASADARLVRNTSPVLMGAPRPQHSTLVRGMARVSSRRAPSPPPPQRC